MIRLLILANAIAGALGIAIVAGVTLAARAAHPSSAPVLGGVDDPTAIWLSSDCGWLGWSLGLFLILLFLANALALARLRTRTKSHAVRPLA